MMKLLLGGVVIPKLIHVRWRCYLQTGFFGVFLEWHKKSHFLWEHVFWTRIKRSMSECAYPWHHSAADVTTKLLVKTWIPSVLQTTCQGWTLSIFHWHGFQSPSYLAVQQNNDIELLRASGGRACPCITPWCEAARSGATLLKACTASNRGQSATELPCHFSRKWTQVNTWKDEFRSPLFQSFLAVLALSRWRKQQFREHSYAKRCCRFLHFVGKWRLLSEHWGILRWQPEEACDIHICTTTRR